MVILAPTLSWAGPTVELRSYNQIRENLIGDRELPWVNRLRLSAPISPLQGEFSMDGQILSNLINPDNKADLYQASVSWNRPEWGMNAQAGRFLANPFESLILLDGAQVSLGTRRRISGRLFGGLRRHPEISDFDEESTLIGADLTLQPFSSTTLTMGYRYEDDLETVHRQWIVAGAKQALPFFWTPLLYGSIDYLADKTLFGSGRAGLELFPMDALLLSGEFARYNESRDNFEWQDRIFTLFSQGEEWQGRGAAAYRVSSKLSVQAGYSFQRYEVLTTRSEDGHMVDGGFQWIEGVRPWIASVRAFFQDSYGGRSGGFTSSLEKQISLGWRARGSFAVARYDKVTGSEDYALHTGLGCLYAWRWGLELGVNGEINSNIDQTADVRVGVSARYVYF